MNDLCPVCGHRHDQHHPHLQPRNAGPALSPAAFSPEEGDGPPSEGPDGEDGDGPPAPPAGGHCPGRPGEAEAACGCQAAPALEPRSEENHSCGCGHHHHNQPEAGDLSGIAASGPGRAVYRIDNMDCPMEEALIRGRISGLAGVESLEFNLIKRVLTVRHHLDDLKEVEAALDSIGMKAEAVLPGQSQAAQGAEKSQWLRLITAGLLALGAELAHYFQGPDWLALTLALAAIILGGLGTYKKGWIALKNFNLNMNGLMSFAVTGAMIIGQWPEAAMVMVLFNLAEAIEAKSLARARQAIAGLLNLTPELATVKQADGSWAEIAADQVSPGAVLRVRPGERLALDGLVLSGASAVNQAPITGESLPVEKSRGDQVFAGTVNESGSFEYQATAAFENSTLARIIRAVEDAQASRAPIQRFVDRFAQVYTPIVFLAAVAVGLLPPLLLDGQWLDWAYKALVLLVIACPCALVISTPVTIVSGLAAATRHGLLIKGGAFLEEGRKLKWIALDKTGTLTSGRPEQTDFLPLGSFDPAESRRLAAALASRSDHPVSLAIARAAAENAADWPEVKDFTALAGRGVQGLINGQSCFLGNRRLLRERGWLDDQVAAGLDRLEEEGKSVVALVAGSEVRALLAVADRLKESSLAAVKSLKALGLKTIMLTGDNQAVARQVAAEAGLDDYRAGLLPQDKLQVVEELKKSGPVGMVGDGINDAPALASADIGFAMGGAGTDTAIETADVAIMDDDLAKLPAFIRLSRAAKSILWQNISTALGVKLVFFILTFTGQASMWMAVFADVGVSLIVVANSLRMLKK